MLSAIRPLVLHANVKKKEERERVFELDLFGVHGFSYIQGNLETKRLKRFSVYVSDEVLGASSSLMFARRKPSKIDDVESYLNYSLHLAQEWGKHWLQPIQDRLHKACPQLSQDQLNLYNDIAQAAMSLGHDLVYEMAEKDSMKTSKEEWQKKLLEKYPWIDEKNVDHLYSTGMYYAMK